MIDLFTDLFLFAQDAGAEAPANEAAPNPVFQLLPIVAVIVLFYLMMVRPQRNERKKHDALVSALKKNDQVQTIGGIIGTVSHLTDDTVTIKVDDNAKIKMRRSSIQTVLTGNEETKS
ncbi:preprotein translocase subunit YajC [Polystyrenella longa]|uniref:Sec translocon accessory complex subunit YajC n=1 Tax=Polystyrenella longa TaxID=2528007 RepID=A0A518CN40_9PLAN|nr:preprotein translocase subunit YajC [Polystyrenella longa]QDU80613.1 preprotein translocase subunit YajC [Polystyrenella longa]